MAGKELKATEKTVLKHSRDGVLEQNLADGSAKKVSKKAEEAVLKTASPDDERFDKLKAAGLVVEDAKKPDKRKLQFGRNNPDNTWVEAVYGNKPTEQRYSKAEEKHCSEAKDTSADEAESADEKSVENQKTKLKENKTTNRPTEHSTVADKLTDKEGNPVLFCEGEAPPDRKLSHGEKKLKRRIRKDEKKVYKLQKRLDKAEDKLPHQRVFHVRKEWNSEKQKMQRKLKLEKEVKPLEKPNIVQKGVQGAKHAVSLTVSGAVHQQISKYEDDNQTLKAAHGTEYVAESALLFTSNVVKNTNQKLKEKPYKKASKLKFDTENVHKKLNQHKVALEHKTEQQTKKEAKKALKKITVEDKSEKRRQNSKERRLQIGRNGKRHRSDCCKGYYR